MLTKEQIAFYNEHGYLRIPQVFTEAETNQLSDHLDWIIKTWAYPDASWTGPWRKVYMDAATEKKSKLIALHDLQYYSDAWARAISHPNLCQKISQLVEGPVEFHHSTLHVKPPETGHPFPMHQDYAFYQHTDSRYVDVLVHLDDTRHENGEIRFLDGSHRSGPLDHITQTPEGPCSPHLPTDKYQLDQTVAVSAKRGDVVCFNINTVHGSYVNVTSKMRRLVRIGYRHPENKQIGGQSLNRPGLLVWGIRERKEGQGQLNTEMTVVQPTPPQPQLVA